MSGEARRSARDPGRQVIPQSSAGLGLALAKRITEALGGRLEAESEPRAGACFTIHIPLPAAADSKLRAG